MADLQRLLEKELRQTPRLIARNLLVKKLREAQLDPDPELIECLVAHVMSGRSDSFAWDDGKDSKVSSITLSFSTDDLAEIDAAYSRLEASLPDMLECISSDISKSVLKTLTKTWASEHQLQVEEFTQFRLGIERLWGKALGLLRMHLTVSREFGTEVAKANLRDKSKLRSVLTRLHVRACQVTAEIVVLLENGHADGAMARWRTLHEIGIVTVLMAEHGEALAERYLAHRAVEARSGKDQYSLCAEQTGYAPLTGAQCRKIEKECAVAIAKYGKAFAGPYGWADGFVRAGRRGTVSLGDLEAAAGRSAMASHYKLASYNVHAGPHALFFRLGFIDQGGFLGGASNAGLLEPGQNTALTLTLISAMLLGVGPNLDQLVAIKILQAIQLEIPIAFATAERKLDALHARQTRKAEQVPRTRKRRMR